MTIVLHMALDLAMIMGSLPLILAVLLPLLHRLDQKKVLQRLDQEKLNKTPKQVLLQVTLLLEPLPVCFFYWYYCCIYWICNWDKQLDLT